MGMCLTACGAEKSGESTALRAPDASAASMTEPAQLTTQPLSEAVTTIADVPVDDGCAPTPIVELRSDADVVIADVVYYGESSPSCSFNSDGSAMFDNAFRPERALVTNDGHFEIAVDQPGDVAVDVRLLQSDTGLATIDPGAQALSAGGGAYSLALPGSGCFAVTVKFNTDTQSGQFTALAASSPDAC